MNEKLDNSIVREAIKLLTPDADPNVIAEIDLNLVSEYFLSLRENSREVAQKLLDAATFLYCNGLTYYGYAEDDPERLTRYRSDTKEELSDAGVIDYAKGFIR
jgi:hypothetical protein